MRLKQKMRKLAPLCTQQRNQTLSFLIVGSGTPGPTFIERNRIMTNALNLLILPGDGIGREVMTQVTRVVDWFGENRGIQFNLDHDEVGGASYDKYGTPVTDSVVERAQAADAVLFGAVGGPQYDNLPVEHRAEQGLLRLRKDLDLFANLRPAQCFDALADASV